MLISVPYTEKLKLLLDSIFTDAFMRENTNFEDFAAFRYSSEVFVSWRSETLVYEEERLNGFVKESTRFGTWDEMVKAATDEIFTTKYTESD
jgi:hypothetical protein